MGIWSLHHQTPGDSTVSLGPLGLPSGQVMTFPSSAAPLGGGLGGSQEAHPAAFDLRKWEEGRSFD